MDETSIDLHGLADKGFIRFSIKAEDTPENELIHNAFKQFAEIEADNNYTLGLRILLKNYEADYRFNILAMDLEALRDEIVFLKGELAKVKGLGDGPKKKDVEEVF